MFSIDPCPFTGPISFADEYACAEVIGMDLSPIQPRWVPPNLKFEIDDAEATWTYPYKFDFIFLRGMGGSIKDIPRLLRQAYVNLNPGGWIEWHEYETTIQSRDGPLNEETSHVAKWLKNVHEGARKFGKDLNIAPTLKSAIEKAGFVEVEEKIYEVSFRSRVPLPFLPHKYSADVRFSLRSL